MSDARSKSPKTLLGLLGAMTLLTFGGPVGFSVVLKGGNSPDWPPDRTVEWVYLIANAGLILGLMIAIVVKGIRDQRAGIAPHPKDPA